MKYIGKLAAIILVCFAIGALHHGVAWTRLWWAASQALGHNVAKVILLAPVGSLFASVILLLGARCAWQLSEGRVEP